ncbi:hypothetical protein FRAAL2531 [Frankia alni ACN14a]|uniref:HTH-like domain-containing protein n=1 Tax=Frankia alni (strain DSM 45986 / CECT 9034 / ACN14a) TaxID=326424 RepID=Q0RMR9_FRAAA|nr:hypothetical protein FRAAL2531 [Frankia alni ACN14a]
MFAASRQTYGARRIAAALTTSGRPTSVRLVRRIMRRAGLKGCQPKAYRRTTTPGQAPARRPHPPRLHRHPPWRQARRGHHLRPHGRRMAVSRHRHRPLLPQGHRLVDGEPHAHRTHHRRVHHGHLPHRPHIRRDLSSDRGTQVIRRSSG